LEFKIWNLTKENTLKFRIELKNKKNKHRACSFPNSYMPNFLRWKRWSYEGKDRKHL